MAKNQIKVKEDSKEEVEKRLAQINAALEALSNPQQDKEKKNNITILNSAKFLSDSDPAEKIMCEACQ